jgi:membrane protein YdbS with pleckstrin-like domain
MYDLAEDKKEELYSINPNFNFIYELFLPTGRKIKNTLSILILISIFTIGTYLYGNGIEALNFKINGNLSVLNIIEYILLIVLALLALKLTFHIILQTLQYKHISYRFYDKYMVYEDDFLNQHKKVIQYANIKEVEIRRTIWDRLMGFGVIVIYTNADNEFNNGLVIYSIKDPKGKYDRIDKMIHSIISDNNNYFSREKEEKKAEDIYIKDEPKNTEENISVKEQEVAEKDFLDSIKNINE